MWLLPLVGIIAVAFNLRPVVTSVGPFLGEIQAGLGLSGTATGALTALPVLSFAGFGARALAPDQLTFFLASGVALAGVAASNVLVPVLVRQYYPGRIGTVTGLYSMVLSVGT